MCLEAGSFKRSALKGSELNGSRLKGSDRINLMHRQTGLGLPAAIFVIVVLSLIVLALANLEERSSEALGQDVQSSHAFWAAESGAQAALSRLFPPGSAASDCSDSYFSATPGATVHSIPAGVPGLANCTFEVTCAVQTDTAGNNYFSLQSTGVCGSGIDRAQRSVAVGARDLVP
jgi:MSHA biogenesis protein MshP